MHLPERNMHAPDFFQGKKDMVCRDRFADILVSMFVMFFHVMSLTASPLHDAAVAGDIDSIKKAIVDGEDLSSRDEHGRTAIECARRNNRTETSAFLSSLQVRRYPSGSVYTGQMKDGREEGWGVYRTTHGSGYSGEFRAGLFHGKGVWRYASGRIYRGNFFKGLMADIDPGKTDRFGEEALFHAVRTGEEGRVLSLLERGANARAVNRHGQTPLHFAAYENYTRIARMLVSHGAGVNSRDENGLTPLHLAAFENRAEAALFLLSSGADANMPDIDGLRPLHLAAYRDSLETARVLVEKGAFIAARDRYNRTPLYHARELGSRRVADFLILAR